MTPGDEDQGLSEQSVGTDQQLFDGALADEAPKETEQVADEPAKAEPAEASQPRTPDGKFATKETQKSEPAPVEAAEKPADVPEKEKDGWIPAWRVREIREQAEQRATNEANELRRQIAQLQKPPETKVAEVPDSLIDPQAYNKYVLNAVEEKIRNAYGEISLRMARNSNPELFDKAYEAITRANDALSFDRVKSASDPGQELINWYREVETRREVGNDPAAYKQRVLEEALKDPAYLAKAIEAARGSASGSTSTSQPNGGTRPAVRLPPSLTGAARADAANSAEDGDLLSDASLFNQALSPSR